MKVGIVGVGSVGTACAMALLQRGTATEIILVDLNEARATAVAADMGTGYPSLHPFKSVKVPTMISPTLIS
jgi:L-lactate dehydrogenase